MATALIVLALGSILAGYVGIPHALGGHNNLGAWLEPAFNATNCGAAGHDRRARRHGDRRLPARSRSGKPAEHTSLELTLMAVSSLVAFAGIGLATFLWLKHKEIPARMAQQYPRRAPAAAEQVLR